VGVAVTRGDDLAAAIAGELRTPGWLSSVRAARLEERFIRLDGRAAERAIPEVAKAAREGVGARLR
jgi:hypothetical protein